jgi:hypothetical protein
LVVTTTKQQHMRSLINIIVVEIKRRLKILPKTKQKLIKKVAFNEKAERKFIQFHNLII